MVWKSCISIALFGLLTIAAGGADVAQSPATARESGISGAGSTFAAPIYTAWAKDYLTATGKPVRYEAVGSAAGLQKIIQASVDFGGTDIPLTGVELEKNHLLQFPSVLGGVVPVINMPGIDGGKLRLDGPTLAAIFSGVISHWNDPRIQALNPGLTLPEWPVTVVHRGDKSGTTFQFTAYLSVVSPAWKFGASSAVNWPVGLAGTGNGGINEIMGSTIGTIGYVEYPYAQEHHLDLVLVKNHDGQFVLPDGEAFRAAAAGTNWAQAPGMGVSLLDRPGVKAWPITSATFVLVREDIAKERLGDVLGFFDWSLRNGDAQAQAMGYAPLPSAVKALAQTRWKQSH